MAIIDKSFYLGTDIYSDGDETENSILEIVKERKKLDELEEISWPLLYHLSPVRENICNWYPFVPGSRVLEVGAGCGAVTGALCGKGLDVYSVDLSLRRSTINYERHKECEELHLMVGNLNDMSFDEPFDYILVNGVLEYAGKFTEGENPHKTFLEKLRSFIKPTGILLLAIENRLGLKYFAGAPEDHIGEPFVGLRGYDSDTGIKTFSKSELSGLLEQSGFGTYRFYYPYPDYKFPMEIFTDKTLVSQHYGKPYQVFDRDRVEIFPELKVAPVIAADGAAGALANSFLVEVSATDLSPLQVYYAKLNSGRNEEFRIGTKIYGAGELSLVSKFSLCETADDHIRRTAANEADLGQYRKVLSGQHEGIEILYDYSTLETLEDVLRLAAEQRNAATVRDIFTRIRELANIHPKECPYGTEEFKKWFGNDKLTCEMAVCVSPANVDLVPDNIFVGNGEFVITDCEWVASFAVPLDFILWRSIENAFSHIPALEETVNKQSLQKELHIEEHDVDVFRSWSWHFENSYVSSGNNVRCAKHVRQTSFNPLQAEQMEAELRNKQGHIDQLMQSERELKGTVGSQEAHIEQLILSERKLMEEVRGLKAELESVYSSRSWKITSGLRKISAKLEKKESDA